ncbi:MAG: hypothetical protein DRI57_05970, partial [Deltaproteobacteria bacterium]
TLIKTHRTALWKWKTTARQAYRVGEGFRFFTQQKTKPATHLNKLSSQSCLNVTAGQCLKATLGWYI